MDRAETPISSSTRLRRVAALVAIAAASGAAAWLSITLTRGDGRVAAVWLPNAILLAFVLRRPSRDTLPAIAAAYLANVLANILVGDAARFAFLLAATNSLEVLIATLLIRRYCAERPDFRDVRQLIAFMPIAGVIAPALPALIAAIVLAPTSEFIALSVAPLWWVTDGLGLLIATPSLMIAADHCRRPFGSDDRHWDWIGLTLGGTGVIVAIFAQSTLPPLLVACPVVLAFAFRLGERGTVFAIAMIAVVATARR